MTDASLPARVARLEEDADRDRNHLVRLENWLVRLAGRQSIEGEPTTREATLREVLAIVEDAARRHQPGEVRNAWGLLGEVRSEVAALLTAPAPQPPEPEPVEIPNAVGADSPFKLGSAISAIGEVVDVVNGDPRFTVAGQRASLEQVRVIVDNALGPQPQPADGLVERLGHAIRLLLPLARGYAPEGQSDSAKRSCRAAVSVAEGILEEFAAYEQERERAKEQGDQP